MSHHENETDHRTDHAHPATETETTPDAQTTDAVTPGDAPDPGQPSDETVELAAEVFEAARTGDTDTLEAYIVAGVDPDLQDGAGDTVLTLAVRHGHAQTVAMLARLGADPDAGEPSARDLARTSGGAEIAAALLEGGPRR